MHEKLYEQIDAMDEKVIKIANSCLDNLEKALDADDNDASPANAGNAVKFIGEGLKALAEGLESYIAVTNTIKAIKTETSTTETDVHKKESFTVPTEPLMGRGLQ